MESTEQNEVVEVRLDMNTDTDGHYVTMDEHLRGYIPKDQAVFIIWFMTGCGCLPVVGMLIGLFMMIPVTIVLTLTCTAISLVYTFVHLPLIYYTVVRTDTIGPNLKVIGCLTLWIPIILWPFIVFFVAVGSALGGSFIYAIYKTFAEDGYCFWKTVYHIGRKTIKMVYKYWKFNHKNVIEYLSEERQPHPGIVPIDIKLHKIPLCLLAAIYGVFVDGFAIAFIVISKSPLILIKTYAYIWKFYVDSEGECILMCIIPMIVAQLIIPLVWLCAIIVFVIAGFGVGVYVAWPAYQTGPSAAIKKSWEIITDVDKMTGEYIDTDCRCCPTTNV